ncbi:Phosphorylase superfamily protein [Pilibacter termitis]|uniref:Phosphorylase superfamily protein n=1 Tax=Pilibacter termitis TaxID=263852 RepID=A0A1T4Q3F4_9ENTE|nr:5'-methylthioadenosine/S-adenosylhomocysteine nucleosidase [Pilibacter termitis]SJZ98194.1 Phosphorylase superfamily protein [Pilibacter termitis]
MRIGVVCSVNNEIEFLLDEMEHLTEEKIADFLFYKGEIKGKKIVLAYLYNREKKNIQVLAEMLIQEFQVQHLIGVGFSGAIAYSLSPLAVVIGEKYKIENSEATFSADEKLVQIFKKVYPSSEIGCIYTKEQFLTDIEEKRKIWELGAIAVDMESAFLAEIACNYQIPFISVRIITDFANDTAVKTFQNYENLAAEKSVDILIEGLKSRYY